MRKFGFLNIFGITPQTNHDAAGYDFFIPLLPTDAEMTDELRETVIKAFCDSYKLKRDELLEIADKIVLNVTAMQSEAHAAQVWNILHLYLALTSWSLNELDTIDERIEFFCDCYLVFDNDLKPGVTLEVNDIMFINSGVKTYFKSGTAGLFVNKSGRGTKGWNVLACLVDPDYTGYVHLNLGFTSDVADNGTIFCGDKFTQMIVIDYNKEDNIELTEEEFNKLHEGSTRGDNGFGSSNEKH